MTPAERKAEIIMIPGKGVLRMCTAGRMQAENSSNKNPLQNVSFMMHSCCVWLSTIFELKK